MTDFEYGYYDAWLNIMLYSWDEASCNYEFNTDIDNSTWSANYANGYLKALDEAVNTKEVA